MATGWSNYQVTQGYMEWFYDLKFAVVTIIAAAFTWYSLSRVITALKDSRRNLPVDDIRPKQANDASDKE